MGCPSLRSGCSSRSRSRRRHAGAPPRTALPRGLLSRSSPISLAARRSSLPRRCPKCARRAKRGDLTRRLRAATWLQRSAGRSSPRRRCGTRTAWDTAARRWRRWAAAPRRARTTVWPSRSARHRLRGACTPTPSDGQSCARPTCSTTLITMGACRPTRARRSTRMRKGRGC